MELMDTTQVCEYLGINPNNLYQLQHRKKLNWAEKKGKRVFYNRSDVEALKDTRTK